MNVSDLFIELFSDETAAKAANPAKTAACADASVDADPAKACESLRIDSAGALNFAGIRGRSQTEKSPAGRASARSSQLSQGSQGLIVAAQVASCLTTEKSILGVLDWLGPLEPTAIAAALQMPTGAVMDSVRRLTSASLVVRRQRYIALHPRLAAWVEWQ